jgi:hypothetical protein
MEMSLHRQLKSVYAEKSGLAAQVETPVDGYRIDVRTNEELIEIQVASLSAIRSKVRNLLERHKVRVVKPLIVRKQLVRYAKQGGEIISHRLSPKRGAWIDLVHELMYFRDIFPHPRLTLEVPTVEVLEHRVSRRARRFRGRDYRVLDVELLQVNDGQFLRTTADLLHLYRLVERFGAPSKASGPPRRPSQKTCRPAAEPATQGLFDTRELAEYLEEPRWIAQRLAYVLRHCGALETAGKRRGGWLYRIAPGADRVRRTGRRRA